MNGPYTYGTPITLIGRSWSVNPLTEEAQPQTPAVATFSIEGPDGVVTTYALGDPNVSILATGVLACQIDPPTTPGTYAWDYASDSGDASGEFEVLAPGVAPHVDSPIPISGPCTAWIDAADVADACGDAGVGSNEFELADVAAIATSIVFELSGRQFAGICERTVRPCRARCSCWIGDSIGLIGPGPGSGWYFDGYGSWACHHSNDRCGCGGESYVKLPGYPVRKILEVKVNGDVLDASEYRLDGHRKLLRLSVPGSPPSPRVWPVCQNITLDDDQPGTFSITYTYGLEPPALARRAAAELACNLWNAGGGSGECKLPTKVTRVVRQGVTIERASSIAAVLRMGSTGLPFLDSFIATSNPTKMTRRPAVWTPDVPTMPRRVG